MPLTREQVDRAVFNPAWGIDVTRVISPVPAPTDDILVEALSLYQTAFKKPSITVYVLDYSVQMTSNGGEQRLKEAMRILLTPEQSAQYLLQPGARDITIAIPL